MNKKAIFVLLISATLVIALIVVSLPMVVRHTDTKMRKAAFDINHFGISSFKLGKIDSAIKHFRENRIFFYTCPVFRCRSTPAGEKCVNKTKEGGEE